MVGAGELADTHRPPGEVGERGHAGEERLPTRLCSGTGQVFPRPRRLRCIKGLLLCQQKAHREHDSSYCAQSRDQSPKQAKASQGKKLFSFVFNKSKTKLLELQCQTWLKCFIQNFLKTNNKPTR